jgi:LPXTG-motif cell wall-anchored protein
VSLPRPNGFQAQADPDGMLNGGVDQPGGAGGVDPTDQDGNNGSGNDTDCEDDNRGVGIPGHCKPRPETSGGVTGDVVTPGTTPETGDTVEVTPTPATDTTGTTSTTVAAPMVPVTSGLPPAISLTAQGTASHVAGPVVPTSAGAPPPVDSLLPSTGAAAGVLAMLLTGLVALALGGGLVVSRRRSTA